MPEVLARGRTSSVIGVYRINSSTWTVKRAGFSVAVEVVQKISGF